MRNLEFVCEGDTSPIEKCIERKCTRLKVFGRTMVIDDKTTYSNVFVCGESGDDAVTVQMSENCSKAPKPWKKTTGCNMISETGTIGYSSQMRSNFSSSCLGCNKPCKHIVLTRLSRTGYPNDAIVVVCNLNHDKPLSIENNCKGTCYEPSC